MKQKQIVLMALVMALAIEVKAADRYVDLNCPTPTSPYLYWTNAANTISAAVAVATSGDTIWITNGLYSVTTQINVTAGITIRSVNGPSSVTIARTNDPVVTTRVFYVNSPGAVLDGLTIAGGFVNGSGGGVYMNAGLLTNCAVVSNSLPASLGGVSSWNRGAGAYVVSGSLWNCTVAYNGTPGVNSTAGSGVAMVNGVISQCTIGPSNYSQHGGGAYLLGDVTLSNSTVIANRGFNWGSGVYVSSRCRVESCSIVSNTTASATGQGLLLDLNTGSDFRFRDCRIFGNAVLGLQAYELGYYTAVAATNGTIEHCEIEGNGAGIYLYAASNILVESCRLVKNTGSGILVTGGNNITFRSCEVSRNEQTTASSGIRAAGVYGTGIRMENCTVVANYSIAHPAISSTNSGGVLLTSSEMVNCIVVSNKIGNPASPGLRRSDIILLDNATASYSCSTDLVHGVNGCITNSPQFVVWPVGSGTSATTGNLHLAKGSPCINTGTNTAWMYASFDLDGNRRLRGSHVDMGAYEYPVNGTLFFLR